MKNNISRVVKKFLKDLRYQVEFETVKAYLAKMGYIVMVYDSQGDESGILKKNNLFDYSQSVSALTIDNDDLKIVFLNAENPINDLTYALLHETGHILLGHLTKGKLVNERELETEAEAFVYEVLHFKYNTKIIPITAALLIVLVSCIGLYMNNSTNDIAAPASVTLLPKTTVTATIAPTNTPASASIDSKLKNPLDIVYVTRTGNKYHRKDCQYTKDKDCTTLTLEEAQKHYAPCSVCNP